MSTKRVSEISGWVDTAKLPRGENGRALCRRCATEVPKGRRSFCSEDCVNEWRIRTDPSYVRHKVWERDRGVCAECSTDTESKRADHLRNVHGNTGHLWQADHIVPVVEGGGECGIENYRTLCTSCHKAATAALRKRMKAMRVDAKPLPLIDGGNNAQTGNEVLSR